MVSCAVVVHALNTSTLETEGGRSVHESEAILVYRVSFRRAKAIQRNSVSKNTNKFSTKKKKNSAKRHR